MSQVGINDLITFVPDTPAVAPDVNNNFTVIKDAHNDTDSRVTTLENGQGDFLKTDGSNVLISPLSYKKLTITNATNATPIVLTSAGHNRSTGDKFYIEGIGGTTAANGRFSITVEDPNAFSLDGSVGNGAYTSGGIAYLLPKNLEDVATNAFVQTYGREKVNRGTVTTSFTLTLNKIDLANINASGVVLSLPTSGFIDGVENKCTLDCSVASGISVTLPSGVKWKGGKTPTLSTNSAIRNVLIFKTNDNGATWKGEYDPYGGQVIPFVQPILTSNLTTVTEGNITVTGSLFYTSDYDFYKAMDGNVNTSTMFNTSTGWWQIVYPYYTTITGLIHRSGGYGNSINGDVSGRYYTSASLSTPIGNAFTTPATQGAITNIAGIPTEGIYTNTIYFNKTTSNVNSGIGELLITGTRLITS